jgi:capsular polysaccharide biosynthesis protein
MPISEYLRILRQRGWIIVVSSIMTAASALLFSVIQSPVYQSTVVVLVQPARTDFGLTQSAKLLLDSYVAFLDTDTAASKVIDTLKLDVMPQTLRGDIHIASEAQRFLIRIEVENQHGDLANDIAQKWAELLVQWRHEENQKMRREDRVTAIILDKPRYELDHPKKGVNTAAGGILGMLIGAIIVLVIQYIDSGIIRTRYDIERQIKLSVLGIIPAHLIKRDQLRM